MKSMSRIGFALVMVSAVLAVSESQALAASACAPTPPTECAAGRELRGWNAGVITGVSLVDQIWKSPAVDQDPDNWDILKQDVVTVIPNAVTGLPMTSQYVKCRAQALLEGATCRMMELDPSHLCALDGFDWGNISAAIYCDLSVALGGLENVTPWYIRPVPGVCGEQFQSWCEDVYRYVATNAGDPFETPAHDVLPYTPYGIPECVPFTVDPHYLTFNNSVYVDCTYNIPPVP